MILQSLSIEETRALQSIVKHRGALYELRKEIRMSRTDIEVLAYAKLRCGVFSIYDLKQYYFGTNVQQLWASVRRLETAKALELVQRGVKNKTSTYWLTSYGEQLIDQYIELVN